jgi:hypothetical protein
VPRRARRRRVPNRGVKRLRHPNGVGRSPANERAPRRKGRRGVSNLFSV